MYDAALALSLAGIHAVVDGKVAADHVGASGGGIAGELVRLVLGVGGVFAVVDADGAGVALAGAVAFVQRVGPVAALAQAWGRGRQYGRQSRANWRGVGSPVRYIM